LGANADAIKERSRFTRPMNYLGVPALVVPVAHSAEGLPIGCLSATTQEVNDEHQRVL